MSRALAAEQLKVTVADLFFVEEFGTGLMVDILKHSEVKGLMIPEGRHLQDMVEVSTALMLNELVQVLLSIYVYRNLMHIKIMNQ